MWSRFKTGQYGAFTGAKPPTYGGGNIGRMSPPPPGVRVTGGNSQAQKVVKVPGGNARQHLRPGTISGREELQGLYRNRINDGEIPTMFGNRRIPGN